jgi:DNA polymerase-3 subunit delta'
LSESTTQADLKNPSAIGWQTFGHDAAIRILNTANMAERLSHAYLITGPDQVGRRTLAIDLACLVNCEPQPDLFGDLPSIDLTSNPTAQRIRKGLHADVRIIDTATQLKGDKKADDVERGSASRQRISINHIHDLQRDAALKPFEGKARVFILDNAEMLSAEAANALLKTLEEPSEDIYIVLVASTVEALPDTIVSRCQKINLRPVVPQQISEKLVERFDVDPEKADRLAKLSAGKPGWAISALQDPAVLELYSQTAFRILSAVSSGLEERFIYARELSGRFWRDRTAVLAELHRWLEWWRDVAVARAGLTDNVVNSDWIMAFDEMAKQLNEASIAAAANLVSSTIAALEANAIPRLALEVMMLELPAITLSDQALKPAAVAAGQN